MENKDCLGDGPVSRCIPPGLTPWCDQVLESGILAFDTTLHDARSRYSSLQGGISIDLGPWHTRRFSCLPRSLYSGYRDLQGGSHVFPGLLTQVIAISEEDFEPFQVSGLRLMPSGISCPHVSRLRLLPPLGFSCPHVFRLKLWLPRGISCPPGLRPLAQASWEVSTTPHTFGLGST